MKENKISSPTNHSQILARLRDIQSAAELKEMASTLPESQADELIECLLKDKEEFNRLIRGHLSLCHVAKGFPQFADQLIDVVISDLKNFKQIILAPSFLNKVVAALTPTATNKLIDFIFNNEAKVYKEFIDNPYSLSSFLFHRNLHPYADKLINHLLEDPDYFKQVVGFMGNLLRIAMVTPQHADTFFNRVIKDSEHFNKLISNKLYLSKQFRNFPKYATVFDASVPPEENEKARQLFLLNAQHAEIRKNARLFAQAERTRSGQLFFNENMPRELRFMMAGFTGNSDLCNEMEAIQIAEEYFTRPSK
ncbi:hypothetical protein [Legionella sp. WA2022007384]